MRVCGLFTLAIVWTGVIRVTTATEMRRYIKSAPTGQEAQGLAATADTFSEKPRLKGRRKKSSAGGKRQNASKPFFDVNLPTNQKRSASYHEGVASSPLTSEEHDAPNAVSAETCTTPAPPKSTLLTLASHGLETYTATVPPTPSKYQVQGTSIAQNRVGAQPEEESSDRATPSSISNAPRDTVTSGTGSNEDEMKEEETAMEKDAKKKEENAGVITENNMEKEEGQGETDNHLDLKEYLNDSQEERPKKKDIKGGNDTLDLAHELSTAADAETKEIENHVTNEARKVINQAECIDEAVLKLKDMTGRVKMAQAASESAKNIEGSIREMEQELEKDEAGLRDAESEEKQGIMRNLVNEPTHGGKDALDLQVDKAEKELEENRDNLREKEEEEDCETTHDIKTFEKEMQGETAPLPLDPNARANELKKEELLATTANERANVENKAADMDLDDAIRKVDDAEDIVKDAEIESSTAKEELSAPPPHIGGDETPCEENKALVTQSTMAASEARDAQEKLEKTKKDLEEAEVLAQRASEEAKQATEDEELEKGDCQTEEARPETKEKTQTAIQQSSELEERVRQLRARVSELSTALSAQQLTAEHEAVVRLKRQEEDCQSREATNAPVPAGQYQGTGCLPPPPKCSSTNAEHVPAVVTSVGASQPVDTKMDEAAKVDRLENRSIDAEPPPIAPEGPARTSFIRKGKTLKDIRRHAYGVAI